MVLKQTLLQSAKKTRRQNPDAYFENVTYPARTIFAPPRELHYEYLAHKDDKPWYDAVFRPRYIYSIKNNPTAMEHLLKLIELSKTKDVYFVTCKKEYPCHRFILLDICKELGATVVV